MRQFKIIPENEIKEVNIIRKNSLIRREIRKKPVSWSGCYASWGQNRPLRELSDIDNYVDYYGYGEGHVTNGSLDEFQMFSINLGSAQIGPYIRGIENSFISQVMLNGLMEEALDEYTRKYYELTKIGEMFGANHYVLLPTTSIRKSQRSIEAEYSGTDRESRKIVGVDYSFTDWEDQLKRWMENRSVLKDTLELHFNGFAFK